MKNRTAKLIKADDLFISSPYEVYKIIFELFAGEKAQARFDANPKTVIKEWKIVWLPDIEINRPKVDRISENKISDLKAFHGVGTPSLFSFQIFYRDGFCVRLSGCHLALFQLARNKSWVVKKNVKTPLKILRRFLRSLFHNSC